MPCSCLTRSTAPPVGTWRAHSSRITRLRPFVQAGGHAQTAAGTILHAVGNHPWHHIRPALLGWPRPVGRATRLPAQRGAPSGPPFASVRAARSLGQATEPFVKLGAQAWIPKTLPYKIPGKSQSNNQNAAKNQRIKSHLNPTHPIPLQNEIKTIKIPG